MIHLCAPTYSDISTAAAVAPRAALCNGMRYDVKRLLSFNTAGISRGSRASSEMLYPASGPSSSISSFRTPKSSDKSGSKSRVSVRMAPRPILHSADLLGATFFTTHLSQWLLSGSLVGSLQKQICMVHYFRQESLGRSFLHRL